MAEADLHLKLDRILARQDDHTAAVAGLEEVLSMVLQGVHQLVPLLNAQTEMLRKIMEAAAGEEASDGEMAKLIRHIAAALSQQTADLGVIRVTLQRLPGQVEAAAIDGIRLAVNEGADLPDSNGHGSAG